MTQEQQGGGAFGAYVRAQRRVARLSLRQLSELTQISNPYLSQIERGLHQPSVTVIKNLARALGVSVEALLAQAAGVGRQQGPAEGTTEAAIAADDRLDDVQRAALLAVYHSMVGGPEADVATTAPAAPAPAPAASGRPPTKAATTARPAGRAAPAARPTAKKAAPAKRAATTTRRPARKSPPRP